MTFVAVPLFSPGLYRLDAIQLCSSFNVGVNKSFTVLPFGHTKPNAWFLSSF